MLAPVALAILAVALAWPVPLLLARALWPSRAPAAALLLWQAIAIAGGLSMIGALLSFGVAPYGENLVGGALGLLDRGVGTIALGSAFALTLAALLTFHLLLNLAMTIARSERERRRHAQLVQLLSSPMDDAPGTRLLNTPAPVAYCLPGAMRSITVVSAGLVALLDPDEMRAVVEHEKAHVGQRHDIVLVAFRAWHSALPWFPIAFRAQREVGLLIEMLADDRARRVVPTSVLARAIVLVGAGRGEPADREPVVFGEPVDAASTDRLQARITRLGAPPLSGAARTSVVLAAVALLAVPTGLLLTPAVADLLAR